MNIKEIKEILNLMREHGLSEIELEKEGIKLRLRKASSGQVVMENPMPVAQVPVTNARRVSDAQPAAGGGQSQAAEGDYIKSPMVGTFYTAPAPDQPAYVAVGQAIKEGDVLCIVEAMKLMNEIKAEFAGVIEELLIKNGEPVEFDQPLFRIRKT